MQVVTLTTDFGIRDPYVATMKGVILRIAPAVTLVDISHDIAPHSVTEAAYILAGAYRYFPAGTIHLAVVDPGVGGGRRAVAVRSGEHRFVAPDNGLLTLALRGEKWEAVELTNDRYWLPNVSHTFHGRDLFAPVAAHLARGVPLDWLGPAVNDLSQLPWPAPSRTPEGTVIGHVVHVDRFGNLITDIPADLLEDLGSVRIEIGSLQMERLSETYAEGTPGQILALIGSHGYLEVAVREGSAASMTGLGTGAPVALRPRYASE